MFDTLFQGRTSSAGTKGGLKSRLLEDSLRTHSMDGILLQAVAALGCLPTRSLRTECRVTSNIYVAVERDRACTKHGARSKRKMFTTVECRGVEQSQAPVRANVTEHGTL